MKNNIKLLMLGVSCLGIAACDVDQKKEAELPDVEINASGGQLPEFEVTGPDVNVTTENVVVEVPKVDVDVPQENEQ